MKKWKTVTSEVAYETDVFRVLKERVQAPTGEEFPYAYVVDTTPGVIVVPETKNETLLMVKHYRHGIKEVMFEFPGGAQSDGETLQEAAERELMEETGVIAKTIELIGKVATTPSYSNQFTQVYAAAGIAWKTDRQTDRTELIEVIELPLKAVAEKVRTGEIWASDTVAAFYLYLKKYHTNKKL